MVFYKEQKQLKFESSEHQNSCQDAVNIAVWLDFFLSINFVGVPLHMIVLKNRALTRASEI